MCDRNVYDSLCWMDIACIGACRKRPLIIRIILRIDVLVIHFCPLYTSVHCTLLSTVHFCPRRTVLQGWGVEICNGALLWSSKSEILLNGKIRNTPTTSQSRCDGLNSTISVWWNFHGSHFWRDTPNIERMVWLSHAPPTQKPPIIPNFANFVSIWMKLGGKVLD